MEADASFEPARLLDTVLASYRTEERRTYDDACVCVCACVHTWAAAQGFNSHACSSADTLVLLNEIAHALVYGVAGAETMRPEELAAHPQILQLLIQFSEKELSSGADTEAQSHAGVEAGMVAHAESGGAEAAAASSTAPRASVAATSGRDDAHMRVRASLLSFIQMHQQLYVRLHAHMPDFDTSYGLLHAGSTIRADGRGVHLDVPLGPGSLFALQAYTDCGLAVKSMPLERYQLPSTAVYFRLPEHTHSQTQTRTHTHSDVGAVIDAAGTASHMRDAATADDSGQGIPVVTPAIPQLPWCTPTGRALIAAAEACVRALRERELGSPVSTRLLRPMAQGLQLCRAWMRRELLDGGLRPNTWEDGKPGISWRRHIFRASCVLQDADAAIARYTSVQHLIEHPARVDHGQRRRHVLVAFIREACDAAVREAQAAGLCLILWVQEVCAAHAPTVFSPLAPDLPTSPKSSLRLAVAAALLRLAGVSAAVGDGAQGELDSYDSGAVVAVPQEVGTRSCWPGWLCSPRAAGATAPMPKLASIYSGANALMLDGALSPAHAGVADPFTTRVLQRLRAEGLPHSGNPLLWLAPSGNTAAFVREVLAPLSNSCTQAGSSTLAAVLVRHAVDGFLCALVTHAMQSNVHLVQRLVLQATSDVGLQEGAQYVHELPIFAGAPPSPQLPLRPELSACIQLAVDTMFIRCWLLAHGPYATPTTATATAGYMGVGSASKHPMTPASRMKPHATPGTAHRPSATLASPFAARSPLSAVGSPSRGPTAAGAKVATGYEIPPTAAACLSLLVRAQAGASGIDTLTDWLYTLSMEWFEGEDIAFSLAPYTAGCAAHASAFGLALAVIEVVAKLPSPRRTTNIGAEVSRDQHVATPATPLRPRGSDAGRGAVAHPRYPKNVVVPVTVDDDHQPAAARSAGASTPTARPYDGHTFPSREDARALLCALASRDGVESWPSTGNATAATGQGCQQSGLVTPKRSNHAYAANAATLSAARPTWDRVGSPQPIATQGIDAVVLEDDAPMPSGLLRAVRSRMLLAPEDGDIEGLLAIDVQIPAVGLTATMQTLLQGFREVAASMAEAQGV